MRREDIKESKAQRAARIAGTGNGATLRTRVKPDKSKYCRKIKHKSIALAMDFALNGLAEFLETFFKWLNCFLTLEQGAHLVQERHKLAFG